jgi:hypothetical protein
MYAVVVRVSINDSDGAENELKETVVPRISQSPGFVAGYWSRALDHTNGLSMLVFESEEAARAVADRIGGNIPEGVSLESAEVREIVANA